MRDQRLMKPLVAFDIQTFCNGHLGFPLRGQAGYLQV